MSWLLDQLREDNPQLRYQNIHALRRVIEKAMERAKKSPSSFISQKLESYGIPVDYDEKDADGQYQRGAN